jgi:hypothetical protein
MGIMLVSLGIFGLVVVVVFWRAFATGGSTSDEPNLMFGPERSRVSREARDVKN